MAQRQRDALVGVEAAEQDRHGEGGDLALGDGARGQPLDHEADLLGRERPAVAFADDDLLRQHQARCARPKAPGKSAPIVVRARSPSGPARMTGVVRQGELGELLAAAAAGGDDLGAVGHHQHLGDRGLAGGDHRGDGAGLGAGALRIGDVLDVAADEDAAVRAAQRRADLEARIGRMGVGAGARGRFRGGPSTGSGGWLAPTMGAARPD